MGAKSGPSGEDEKWMQKCLGLARKGQGRVSPNPMVGAVLVRGGKMISKGYHRKLGGPHAEVECLKNVRGDLSSATLYVNLEPCAHYGKTPPCAPRVVSAGVGRVVVAMRDPNPLVQGKGIGILRRAGVSVEVGTLAEEAAALNRHFLRQISSRRPYVHLKMAQTIDGMIAGKRGAEVRITSRPSRMLVHEWRSEIDAVLIGAGTLRADNPSITVRLVNGRDPAVVILDGSFRVLEEAKVFRSAKRRKVYLVTTMRSVERDQRKAERLVRRGARLLILPGRNTIGIQAVLDRLYQEQIGSILVEGGADVFHQFRKSGLFDELSLFVSPKSLPGGKPLFGEAKQRNSKRVVPFKTMTTALIGNDILLNYKR